MGSKKKVEKRRCDLCIHYKEGVCYEFYKVIKDVLKEVCNRYERNFD